MSREVCFEEMSDNDMLKGLTQNTFILNESNFTEGPVNSFDAFSLFNFFLKRHRKN